MIMESFDIHSLFTYIPLDEAISICVEIESKRFLKKRFPKTFKIIGMYTCICIIYIYIIMLFIQ